MLLQPIVGGYLLASPGATTCSELADKYRLDPELTDAAMVLWAEGFMRDVNEDVRPEARRAPRTSLTADKQTGILQLISGGISSLSLTCRIFMPRSANQWDKQTW